MKKRIRLAAAAVLLLATLSTLSVARTRTTEHEREAGHILETTGIKGGLVVQIGCGDGKVTAALRANDSYLVHGLDADPANVEKARDHVRSFGLYGRVSVERLEGGRLPYTDNLVNLIVSEDLDDISMDEVMRVLCPNGVAYVREEGEWVKRVKPWPDEIDEWTHYLHDATNNAVAQDTRVGPPRHMQWVAKPLYCRSHEIDSSVSALVSARGRLFYILDEGLTGVTDERLPSQWHLVARDAFSGVLLWKRPIPRWGWREWKEAELKGKDWTRLRGQRIRSPSVLPRRLVADGERVYVTLGYESPVTALDAATGEIVRVYEGTAGTDEILYSQGILALCIRKPSDEQTNRDAKGGPPDSIIAVDSQNGEILWGAQEESVMATTLAVGEDRVFFHNFKELVCLELKTGREVWRTPSKGTQRDMWTPATTLVVHDGVVLSLGPRRLEAFSARTGKVLWTGSGADGPGVQNPPDVFVADGLVWYGGFDGLRDRRKVRAATDVRKSGYDPRTGEVKRIVERQNLITPGHHFRCYRSKATDRYLLWPKRGVEFIDLKSDDHMRHDWLRAPCRLGLMPCNGLLYVPPHQCFCYPGVKLNGFNALASRLQTKSRGPERRHRRSLEQGPAYNAAAGGQDAPDTDDWPTYRHDPKRSGSTASAVPAGLANLWQVDLGGKITQPVVAGGRVFVASVDAHTVWCLDTRQGDRLWSYTAGGRVDSPPTIYRGLVLFGSADGWVYSLRASDGKLVWRFRAAPDNRRVVAFGQLESPWPVHGSVLLKDDVAYFAAGRSSYLDGGIYVYGLNPITGEVMHEARVEGPYPDIEKDVGRPFDMEGTKADVLVTDGTFLHMQQTVLDSSLAEQEAPRLSAMGDRKVGRHIFSTAGFLDDSWFNRTFWTYSETWPGYYIGNQAPKSGQLLVFDTDTTYGVKVYTRRNRHSPMFFPGTDGYLLFADDNDTEPVLVGKDREIKPVKWLPDVPREIGHKLEGVAVDQDKGTGFTRVVPPKWAVWVPVRVRAMALADETLFAAGPPDVLDPNDPLAAFEGRKGALLWAVSAEDGTKLAEYKLDSPPVFDGMIAANGSLYMSNTDGRVVCMRGGQ
jgi:outer membrane protein assembly factor BamB